MTLNTALLFPCNWSPRWWRGVLWIHHECRSVGDVCCGGKRITKCIIIITGRQIKPNNTNCCLGVVWSVWVMLRRGGGDAAECRFTHTLFIERIPSGVYKYFTYDLYIFRAMNESFQSPQNDHCELTCSGLNLLDCSCQYLPVLEFTCCDCVLEQRARRVVSAWWDSDAADKQTAAELTSDSGFCLGKQQTRDSESVEACKSTENVWNADFTVLFWWFHERGDVLYIMQTEIFTARLHKCKTVNNPPCCLCSTWICCIAAATLQPLLNETCPKSQTVSDKKEMFSVFFFF